MLWLLSGPPGFTCWISFDPVFSFMYCLVLIFALSPFYILIYMCSGIQFYVLLIPYLCFISFLYLDLYVLGDDDKLGVFHANQNLCVLIHI